MKTNIFLIFNALSIDVCLGAACTMYCMAKVVGVVLPLEVYLALIAAVWCVYLLDHLLDGWQGVLPTESFRHQLSRRWWPIYILLIAVCLGVGVWAALRIPEPIVYNGLKMSILLVLYFLYLAFSSKFKKSYKEWFIGVGYALGVGLGPMSMVEAISFGPLMLLVQIALLAWCNLLILAVFEQKQDAEYGFTSFVLSYGEQLSRKTLHILFALVFASMLLVVMLAEYGSILMQSQLIIVLMVILLMGVFYFPGFSRPNHRYRYWSDLVFLLPALSYFF